jgi:hypothetical protein
MPTLRIRYEGEFDYQGLYELFGTFFRKRNYDFLETGWKEKDATPVGREITVRFNPEKNVTEYVKYTYRIHWKCADAHETTDKLMFARMHIYVDPDIKIDWQGYAKGRSKLKQFYDKYIVKKELDDVHRQEIGIEAQTLIDQINEFIGTEV